MHVTGIFIWSISEFWCVFCVKKICAYIYVVDCKFRQYISVVETSALQSFSIMDLQHCCIRILPPLSGDMQVNECFSIYIYLLLKIFLIDKLWSEWCIFAWPKLFSCSDVVVHRLLAASLGIYKLPNIFQDRPQLTSIADSKTAICFFHCL